MSEVVVVNFYDRCIKCRGCVVACQRNFVNGSLGAMLKSNTDAGVNRLSADEVTVVKSQYGGDYYPMVKYNCWHCSSQPPCSMGCPFRAIQKQSTGEVTVDYSACKPNLCYNGYDYPCHSHCGRGGFPKIGFGINGTKKAFKCDMCYGRRIPLAVNGVTNPKVVEIKTFGSYSSLPNPGVTACVLACPGGALKMGYKGDVDLDAKTVGGTYYKYIQGDGNWYWAGDNMISPPTADPFVEDHVLSLTEEVTGVASKLTVPVLVATGLYALYRRRVEEAEAK